MRATRVLFPVILTLGVALWLALRERAPAVAPAVERGHVVEGVSERAPPASAPREAAVTRSAEFEAPPPPPPPVVVEDGGDRGQAPPAEVGGGWSEDLGAAGVGRAQPRDEDTQTRLTPSELPAGARFGAHVALSGTIAAVAAPITDGNGAVFVFERAGARWNEAARLRLPEDTRHARFGVALDLSGDWLAVGAPGDGGTPGAVLFYRRGAGGWALADELAAPERAAGDGFGADVALAGSRLLVAQASRPCMGYALDGLWRLAGSLHGSGRAFALTTDGEYAVRAAADGERATFELFDWNEGIWEEQAKRDFEACAPGELSVALRDDRLAAVCGDSLRLYRVDLFGVEEEARLALSGQATPRPVALAGPRAFVGDPAGAVQRFAEVGDEWRAERPLVGRDAREGDGLGASLDADGPLVLAGAPGGGYAVVWELAPPVARRPGR